MHRHDTPIVESRAKLDSHADTCVLGPGFLKLYTTNSTCSVAPYLSIYDDMHNIEIVGQATAIQDPDSDKTIILEIHQALWYGDVPGMDHSLINPNQLRHNGTYVQDNPFSTKPLCLKRKDIHIPLYISGTTLYFNCRTPTSSKLNSCCHIRLTSDTPWDPWTVVFSPGPAPDISDSRLSSVTSLRGCPPELRGGVWYNRSHVTPQLSEIRTDRPDLRTFVSTQRHMALSPEEISERWQIPTHQAQKTTWATTQQGIRSALLPLSCRYRADRMFHPPRLRTTIYPDTMFGAFKSIDRNKCAQVFSNSSFFTAVYPMRTKAQAGQALKEFIQDYGVMDTLITDGANEQTGKGTEMVNQVNKYDIKHKVIEPERYNQNCAESAIRELKRRWYRIMVRKDIPGCLWDYGLRWVSDIMQQSTNRVHALHDRTPIEELTGETPNISEYLDFGFYDWVWVRENVGLGEQIFCRWLGVSHRIGAMMCYYVLKPNGQVISSSSVQRVTNIEQSTDEMKERMKRFSHQLLETVKNDDHQLQKDAKQEPGKWRTHQLSTDKEFLEEFKHESSNPVTVEGHQYECNGGLAEGGQAALYTGIELALPKELGEEPVFGQVTKRLRGEDSKPIGRANQNSLLDTRKYKVEFVDGHKGTMFANQIAEAMYAQVDKEGNCHVFLQDIIDHRVNEQALSKDEVFYENKHGGYENVQQGDGNYFYNGVTGAQRGCRLRT